MKRLKVAMIAPPWLALPINGYGGIELVVQSLVKELKTMGIEVVLFGNTSRSLRGVPTKGLYDDELFHKIDEPYYDAPLQILQAHLHYALSEIARSGDFDIIHDHNPYIGPSFFSLATRIPGNPPVLHTFHGPPFSTTATISAGQADNRPQLVYSNVDESRLYFAAISETLGDSAPIEIKSHILAPVHNAVDIDTIPFVEKKSNYYITLARFTSDKGQAVAAKFAAKYHKRLRMAGTVAGIATNQKLFFELANPLSSYRRNEEFRYFSDKVLPYILRNRKITYSGNMKGRRKDSFIANAQALLFPIDWDEPFGMAVIEALASGTPVVAMNRGAMPEIIEHGVNGFLANDEEEFFEYALRVDEIDPRACRKSVQHKFNAKLMAKKYVERYREVISLSKKS